MSNKNMDLRAPSSIKPVGILFDRTLKIRKKVVTVFLFVVVFTSLIVYFRQSYLQNLKSSRATAIDIVSGNLVVTKVGKSSTNLFIQKSYSPTITQMPTSIYSPPPLPTSTTCLTIANVSEWRDIRGEYLSIVCSNGSAYKLGPISEGAYQVSPNGRFLIYCTNDGYLYASRADEQNLRFLENIRPKLPVLRNGSDTQLLVTFIKGENQYWVRIKDQNSGESIDIRIPVMVSQ